MDIAKIDKRTERNIRIAMSQLVLNSPFFSVLLLQQKLVYTVDIPTFATTGEAIFINPIYAKSITTEEIKGVLVHELMHTIFMHLTRRGDRDHKRFNAAADFAINPIIKKENFKLPEGHLDEERFHEMTADKIYKIIDKEQMEFPEELLDLIEEKNLSSSQRTAREQNTKLNVTKAMTAAQGDVPGSIRKLISEVLETKVDWKEKLRQFIQVSLGNDEATWRRPNRNYLYQDVYLPSMEGTTMPSVAIMVDVSGSIFANEKLFKEFKSEIGKIVEDLNPEQVDIFYVDTQVQKHDTFEEGEAVEFELVGGGGTCFRSAWPEMEKINPSCIIAFTDCWASFPETSEVDTMWIVYQNKEPDVPFGTVTIIED